MFITEFSFLTYGTCDYHRISRGFLLNHFLYSAIAKSHAFKEHEGPLAYNLPAAFSWIKLVAYLRNFEEGRSFNGGKHHNAFFHIDDFGS